MTKGATPRKFRQNEKDMGAFRRVAVLGIFGALTASAGFLACGGLVADTAAGDGGADGNGGSDVAAPQGPAGVFFVVQTLNPPEGIGGRPHYSYEAYGGFAVMAPTSAACTAIKAQGCSVSACDLTGGTMSDPRNLVGALNAGTITIAASGGSLKLPYGDGSYNADGETQLFVGGSAISIAGGGGADLPAFAAQRLVAPTDIVVTSPSCSVDSLRSDAGCGDLDRTTDLSVTWTGGGAGIVVAHLETATDTTATYVSCVFEAAGGSGTIPATILGMLKGGPVGNASYIPQNEEHFKVDGADTAFFVQGSGAQGTFHVIK
jgi:hypothetical protein